MREASLNSKDNVLSQSVRFKRVTGRHEVALYPRDYNFFSPRPKPRKPTQQKAHRPSHEDHPQLQSQQQDEMHGSKQQTMGARDVQGGEQRHQDGGESRQQHQLLPMPPELQNSLHHHMVRWHAGFGDSSLGSVQ